MARNRSRATARLDGSARTGSSPSACQRCANASLLAPSISGRIREPVWSVLCALFFSHPSFSRFLCRQCDRHSPRAPRSLSSQHNTAHDEMDERARQRKRCGTPKRWIVPLYTMAFPYRLRCFAGPRSMCPAVATHRGKYHTRPSQHFSAHLPSRYSLYVVEGKLRSKASWCREAVSPCE